MDAVALSKKYNDILHNANINVKDVKFKTFLAHKNDPLLSIIVNRILPPSKSDIGSIFNIPRKSDEAMKSFKNSPMLLNIKTENTAHKKFMAGPEAQITISLKKLPISVRGINVAPKGVSFISRNFTLKR